MVKINGTPATLGDPDSNVAAITQKVNVSTMSAQTKKVVTTVSTQQIETLTDMLTGGLIKLSSLKAVSVGIASKCLNAISGIKKLQSPISNAPADIVKMLPTSTQPPTTTAAQRTANHESNIVSFAIKSSQQIIDQTRADIGKLKDLNAKLNP